MKIEQSNQHSVDTIDASAPTNTEAPVADPPELMPGTSQLEFSGDPGAMLAALTMNMAHSEEKLSRQQRDACASAQSNAEALEINDLREKADLTRIQAVVGGALQIGQAALSFGSAMEGLASDNAKADATEASNDAKGEREIANQPNWTDSQRTEMNGCAQSRDADAVADTRTATRDQNAAAWSKGGGDLCGAVKTLSDGLFNAAITDKDTDSKQHDISAQAFKKMADDAHDDEKDAKDLLNKALDFYKEYVDTKNQTMLAATHRA